MCSRRHLPVAKEHLASIRYLQAFDQLRDLVVGDRFPFGLIVNGQKMNSPGLKINICNDPGSAALSFSLAFDREPHFAYISAQGCSDQRV